MLTYATPTDLAVWMTGNPDATSEEAPANAAALLRSASILVRTSTKNAIYQVDSLGYATDPTLLESFNDATCSQAATWSALGIDPSKGGVAALKTAIASKGLGSVSVSYVQNDGSQQAREALASGAVLTYEAYQLLAGVNLITARAGMGFPYPQQVVSLEPIDIESGRIIEGGLY